MVVQNHIIHFKGMPLFQKASFKAPFDTQGQILDFACFFYMVKGDMMTFDTRGSLMLQEKEAVIKNCNNYVQRYLQTEHAEECEAIAVYLYPELLQEIYRDEIPSFLHSESIPEPRKLISNQLIEQYMNNLTIYFEEPDALDEDLGILKLKELMMILLKSENHASIRQLLSDIFAPVNVAFQQAIQANLFNPLSLDQLAFICNMSLSTFKREFKKAFDDSPAHYIKQRRLEHAAHLLVNSSESVSHIAYACGFQDITTFSASFQDKYHIAPSKYRLSQIRN